MKALTGLRESGGMAGPEGRLTGASGFRDDGDNPERSTCCACRGHRRLPVPESPRRLLKKTHPLRRRPRIRPRRTACLFAQRSDAAPPLDPFPQPERALQDPARPGGDPP